MSEDYHAKALRRGYAGIRDAALGWRRRYESKCWALFAFRPLWWVIGPFDLVIRWSLSLWEALFGDRGYIAAGTIAAVYIFIYGQVDAMHQRELAQASEERSIFMGQVDSGSRATFVAAMRAFSSVQGMEVTDQPSLFAFWEWGAVSTPNMNPLRAWAQNQLELCTPAMCGIDDKWRISLKHMRFFAATLNSVDLHLADLTGAIFSYTDLDTADLQMVAAEDANFDNCSFAYVNFRGADLGGAIFIRSRLVAADFHDANLRRARFIGADLTGANLSNADLTDVSIDATTILTNALFNAQTKFPDGFDPTKKAMMILLDK